MSRRVLVGFHAVTSVLDAGGALERLSVVSGSVGPKLRALLGRAEALGIPVARVDRRALDRLAEGGNHQGVVGMAPPFAYAGLEDIARALEGAGEGGLVLALDGVQDPRNLGAILRSAAAFGVQGVLIPKHAACEVTPAVARTPRRRPPPGPSCWSLAAKARGCDPGSPSGPTCR